MKQNEKALKAITPSEVMTIFRAMKHNESFDFFGRTITIEPATNPSISACLQCDATDWCDPLIERFCRLGDMLYQTPACVREDDAR